MAFVLCCEDALRATAGNADSLVLNLHAQFDGLEKNGQWRFTPPTHVILALSAALDELEAEGGPAARRERYASLCAQLRSGMKKMGFAPLLGDQVQVIAPLLQPKPPSSPHLSASPPCRRRRL